MKQIYIAIGLLAFGLGAVGAAVPILPTTPFLLVTAYCFTKGSKRFHDWFISTRLYKKYLDRFVKERSMSLKSKLLILSYVSVMLMTAFILVSNLHVRVVILIVMACKYYYFFCRIKTKERDKG